MNKLYKAAELLKTKWARGNYRDTKNDTYCAIGALAEQLGGNILLAHESDETALLAEVIKENYPGQVSSSGYPENIVISFNDYVAKDADEVVAMFEKAAARMDERV